MSPNLVFLRAHAYEIQVVRVWGKTLMPPIVERRMLTTRTDGSNYNGGAFFIVKG
jgi:hypothetical protein